MVHPLAWKKLLYNEYDNIQIQKSKILITSIEKKIEYVPTKQFLRKKLTDMIVIAGEIFF